MAGRWRAPAAERPADVRLVVDDGRSRRAIAALPGPDVAVSVAAETSSWRAAYPVPAGRLAGAVTFALECASATVALPGPSEASPRAARAASKRPDGDAERHRAQREHERAVVERRAAMGVLEERLQAERAARAAAERDAVEARGRLRAQGEEARAQAQTARARAAALGRELEQSRVRAQELEAARSAAEKVVATARLIERERDRAVIAARSADDRAAGALARARELEREIDDVRLRAETAERARRRVPELTERTAELERALEAQRAQAVAELRDARARAESEIARLREHARDARAALGRRDQDAAALAMRVAALEDERAAEAQDDRRARVFVWGCWALILATSAYFVLHAGRDVPIQEDWTVIAAATGHQGGFWGWVWEPNNEHRVPIAKLLYVALFQLWPDFRVGMVFNITALAGVAAAFVVVLRRVRGRTRWTDAFFALIFLNLGNWENLGWSWQLTFVIAAAVGAAMLMLLTLPGPWTTRRAALLVGCMLVTPFTGATVLPFAAAIAVAVLVQWRKVAGRARTVLVTGGALTLLFSALYFVDLPKSTWVPPSPGLITDVLTSGKFLALGIGPAAGAWWLVSVLAVSAALASAAWLVWRARRRGGLALLAFLGAGVILAVSAGRGRAGAVPFYGLPDRYVLVAAPLICAIYIVWDRYGGARLRYLGPAALCVTMGLLLPLNSVYGAQWKDWYQTRVDTFAADVQAGVPLAQLVHYRPLGRDATQMWFAMQYMRHDRIGVFARLRLVPPPVRAWAIDGFGDGGAGWESLSGPESRARLLTRSGQREMRWEYHATSRKPAVLGREFDRPADWRGAGGLAFSVTGQGTQRRVRVRLARDAPGGGVERFETWFQDTTAAPTTIVMPWNGFGRANVRGVAVDILKGPLPLTGIRSVTFIIGDTGPGVLRIRRLALTPGHPQLGWPLHSAVQRRSLPPLQ